jgi:molecular chaperone GrpE
MSQEEKKSVDPERVDVGGASDTGSAQDQVDVPLVEHDEVKSLQEELEQALAKADENWNLFVNTKAEMENIRKRSERDLQNAHKFALERFVNELLPVMDGLEMGVAAAAETQDVAQLLEGSELTLKMLGSALDKFGVKEVNPKGAKFNPEVHEAMATQPAAHAEPNTVLQVIQKGYMLNERLIRPALVIVVQADGKA